MDLLQKDEAFTIEERATIEVGIDVTDRNCRRLCEEYLEIDAFLREYWGFMEAGGLWVHWLLQCVVIEYIAALCIIDAGSKLTSLNLVFIGTFFGALAGSLMLATALSTITDKFENLGSEFLRERVHYANSFQGSALAGFAPFVAITEKGGTGVRIFGQLITKQMVISLAVNYAVHVPVVY